MSDFDTGVYLRFLMNKYSEDQPLILLFHNAAAEKGYFELLDIPLSSLCVEAIPHKLLSANVYTNNSDGTRDGAPPMPAHLAIPTPRGPERSAKIILDTQRLYKAFVLDENDKNTKLGLANICRKLGIHTKHLHNAGGSGGKGRGRPRFLRRRKVLGASMLTSRTQILQIIQRQRRPLHPPRPLQTRREADGEDQGQSGRRNRVVCNVGMISKDD